MSEALRINRYKWAVIEGHAAGHNAAANPGHDLPANPYPDGTGAAPFDPAHTCWAWGFHCAFTEDEAGEPAPWRETVSQETVGEETWREDDLALLLAAYPYKPIRRDLARMLGRTPLAIRLKYHRLTTPDTPDTPDEKESTP